MKPLTNAAAYVLTSIAIFLILVATTALWFTNTIGDQERFVELTVEVFSFPEVRDAVSNQIIDDVFGENPLLKTVATDIVKPAVAGLLDSNQLKSLITEAANSFYELAIASTPQDVALDITPLKVIIGVLTAITDSEFNAQEIPSEIVLIEGESVPDIHSIVFTMTWLGPLAGFIGLVMLLAVTFLSSDRFMQIQRIGVVLAFGAFIYLLLVPYVGNVLVAQTSGAYSKTIIGVIYAVFTADLINTLQALMLVAAVLFGTGFIVRRYGIPRRQLKLSEQS
jgi:hypothetical protein